MAYSQKEWDIVKAFFEEGLSLSEIVARPEVAIQDKGGISRRSRKEGWIKGIKTTLLKKEIQCKQDIAEIIDKKSTMTPIELEIHNLLLHESICIMDWLNKKALLNVAQSMELLPDNQTDFKARADTILKGKEAVFGKQPDTAIQINNNQVDDRPRTLSDFYKP